MTAFWDGFDVWLRAPASHLCVFLAVLLIWVANAIDQGRRR